jgi:signal transduction histidine kinase
VEITMSPAGARGPYAVAIARDISARLRAEAELREAKELAEAASRFKTEFLNMASHELRTPLTPLRLHIQSALRRLEVDGTVCPQALRRAERQVTQLSRLVGDLLEASRLELGKVQLQLDDVDLQTLVHDILEDFRLLWPDRLSLEPSTAPTRALCDSVRVEQALVNLIDNALKYSPEGSLIFIRAFAEEQRVCVSVLDQGPGIPREAQESIFERFYRLSTDTTARQRGLGLGLWISRQLVRLQGGDLWVDSGPAGGSAFTLALPRALAAG